MRRAFKFRLWTTEAQDRLLAEMLETHRRLYNACLEERKLKYETEKVSVSCYDQQAAFRAARKSHFWYAKLNAHSAEATIKRLDLAFQAFFRRVKNGEQPGYPNFKGRDYFNGITYGSYPDGLKLTDDRLYVQHVGVIRVRLHRAVEGEIKVGSLKREAGKWYVVLSAIMPDVPERQAPERVLAIDLGLTDFAIGVESGHEAGIAIHVKNPRFLKHELVELRRIQRALSAKKRGGSNRRKAAGRVRKLHVTVRNLRQDWHRQTAAELLDVYDTICVEKLDVKGMIQDGRYSRSISDAGWSGFLASLKHRAEKIGASVVEVDARGTTQTCSGCGAIVPKNLWERRHVCDSCGLDIGRDHNAAINLLHRGLEIMRSHKPAGTTPQAGRVRTGPTGAVAQPKKLGSRRSKASDSLLCVIESNDLGDQSVIQEGDR